MDEAISFKNVKAEDGSKFLGIVFLYMCIGLAITVGVTALVGFIFTNVFPVPYPYISGLTNSNVYFGVMVGAFIAYIILTIWITAGTLKGKGSLVVPFILYAIVMGVLISSFTIFIPVQTLVSTFGLTALAFFAMFLIGWFAKKSIPVFGLVAIGLGMGLMLVTIFNLIWMFIFPASFQIYYLFVTYGILVLVMISTIIDVNHIKQIATSGAAVSNNLALHCAFRLYIDFILTFLRILVIVASRSGRR